MSSRRRICALVAGALLVAAVSLGTAEPAAAQARAVAFDGGSWHSCALTDAGAVLCWGSDSGGQLGNGADGDSQTPAPVAGLASGVAAIATGDAHSCALTNAGAVLCWGANFRGQLGDGTNTHRQTPVPVYGLASGVVAIDAGQEHSCALTGAGGVLCWGGNFLQQLGDGTTTHRSTPVPVAGLGSGVAAIASGGEHNCAMLDGEQGVRCWGRNSSGQLGNGATATSSPPVAASGLPGGIARLVAGQWHSCALTSAGEVLCWGASNFGQLGDGASFASSTPVGVAGLAGVTALAAGAFHNCADAPGQGLRCWGYNVSGQLGDRSTANRDAPVAVWNLSGGVTAVGLGRVHSCASTPSGDAVCWGDNAYGQLGDGTGPRSAQPVEVAGLAGTAQTIEAGLSHACAVAHGDSALCWGANDWSQLGDGGSEDSGAPVYVAGLAGSVSRVAPGNFHGCALTQEGAVVCWGANQSGQLGDGTTTPRATPAEVSGLASGITDVRSGASHSCALTSAGGVLCWGDGHSGQLGDGGTVVRTTPVAVSGLTSGVAAIDAGLIHNCAITAEGSALCWGSNYDGRLGDGNDQGGHQTEPVAVVGLDRDVASISAGGKHSCAVTSAGAALCWGDNAAGQLGDGSQADRSVPTGVAWLDSDVVAIRAGFDHSCALTGDGAVRCWGANGSGQLGDGSFQDSALPVPVAGLPEAIVELAAGWSFSCARGASGRVYCWGADERGQLGDGHTPSVTEPVGVLPEPPQGLAVLAALAALAVLARRRRYGRGA